MLGFSCYDSGRVHGVVIALHPTLYTLHSTELLTHNPEPLTTILTLTGRGGLRRVIAARRVFGVTALATVALRFTCICRVAQRPGQQPIVWNCSQRNIEPYQALEPVCWDFRVMIRDAFMAL